ncbi:MAG: ammonium transporter [Leptospiraceae bacterium]|nr:ammonium transporter [Leptospiraceae bacterium]MDW7975291.1 ammonium transporter [Leptospiraceae bacterium]
MRSSNSKRFGKSIFMLVLFFLFVYTLPVFGEETNSGSSMDINSAYTIDNLWIFLTGILVIWMQAGFAMVESGMNAAKNTVNILFKNLMDFSVGGLIFFIFGYNLMYPGEAFKGGFFGFGGFFIPESSPEEIGGAIIHPQANFLFQLAFAATAATIVSGAVAGRLKFSVYLIYSVFITGLIYPISGFWQWGGGWLAQLGFHDFAGSIIVHAVGGFAGLAATILLGPRIGKFDPDGKPQPMPGHNLALATLGVFILWLGWYGFNPGSQLAIYGKDNVHAVMLVAVNTTLAAMTGAVFSMIGSWIFFRKPDLTMSLNGALAGLVAITANCNVVDNKEAILIGLVAGLLVIAGVKLLDALKIDDPVGAWPVHGLNGLWGGIATGLFGEGKDFVVQVIGSLAVSLWAFATMFILFLILKYTIGIRVSRDEELKGLDIGEHGEEAYNGFTIFTVD